MASASSTTTTPLPTSEANLKERFYRYFQHEVTALQEQMVRLQTTSPTGGELTDALDHCRAGIDRLSHEVKDASSYIPAYDQRTYAEAIKALGEKLQGVRTTLTGGKKKFSFKTARKNESAISIADAAELAKGGLKVPSSSHGGGSKARDGERGGTASVPGQDSGLSSMTGSSFATTPLDKMTPSGEEGDEEKKLELGATTSSSSSSSGVSISNHTNTHIVLPSSSTSSTGTISHLRRTIVDLSPPSTTNTSHAFATLILKNIKDSLILCGQVAGPIHITGVENSVLVVSTRQFRMHASKNVDVYLFCASRPIIEDCENIRFTTMPDAYTSPDSPSSQNQWDHVDDFKWLQAEQSPHWSVLPEAERVRDEVWRDVVPGGHKVGVDDVLRAVGVGVGK